MSITYTALSPRNGDINVPLNSEVVFRIIKTGSAIVLSTLQTVFMIGSGQTKVIEDGNFVNDFGGEIIDNSDGNLTDITVVIIRPSDKPEFDQRIDVTVGVSVS